MKLSRSESTDSSIKQSIYKLNERLDILEELRRKRKQGLLKPMRPEERYQMMKEAWYLHESSWSMREANGYDGYGCNQFTGCIPECIYYPKEGRMEDKEK